MKYYTPENYPDIGKSTIYESMYFLLKMVDFRFSSDRHVSFFSRGGWVYFGNTPHPVTVIARIIPFVVGNPYKPSFVTVTGRGVDQRYIIYMAICLLIFFGNGECDPFTHSKVGKQTVCIAW